MRPLLTLSLLLSTTLIHAQQCDWLTNAAVEYELNPSLPNEVLAGAPGRLVLARQLSGDFVYGQTVYGRAIVEAMDPGDGLPIWSCALFDSVNVESAVVSAEGKAYFAGRFMGTLGFCDGSILGGVPGQVLWHENLFLMAVDLNTGLLEWTRNLSLTHDQALSVSSLALDPQGRLWYSVAEWGIGKAVRVDANGMDQETRVIDGVRLLGTLSFDPWGGLYMSGACDNSGFAFGGEAFTDPGTSGYSMFVLRYRPDGTAGFVEFADDITFQDPTVAATSDGHAYLAGNIFDTSQWGDITFSGPNWVSDVFLTKLDSTGEFLWGVESAPVGSAFIGDLSRANGPCIAVDADDHVYLMGNLRGQVDWGNGVVSNGLTIGAQTISVVAFAPDGTPQWAATSMPGGMFDQAQTLTANAEEGTLHFAGHITAQFTWLPHTTNSGGTQAALFGKLSGLSTGGRERSTELDLVAWPVPAAGVVYVDLPGTKRTSASLVNSVGQLVLTITLVPGRNTIYMTDLRSGLYVLRTAEGSAVRVVKE